MNNKLTNNIPCEETRSYLINFTREHIKTNNLTPPLSPAEIFSISDIIVEKASTSPEYKDYVSVLTGSLVWEETLSGIPYSRRILLMPMCLRNSEKCKAEMDEFGLICLECGNCDLGQLQKKAEELGYVVLIAEGTTVVTALIESGKVEAVIGIGCLSSLEKSFPYITKAAIPAIAIPLLKDGCTDTEADTDWVSEIISIKNNSPARITFDYEKLRAEINNWFNIENLKDIINTSTVTEEIAFEWLSNGGKRWRPFLTVSVFQAIENNFDLISDDIKKLAVSVECFHKASLIHDDIEDNDSYRYDEPALHEKYDVPTAINIGDLLTGWGYKLISETSLSPEKKAKIFTEVAKAHSKLCIGQGEELNWLRNKYPIKSKDIIEIFRLKTSPAFEVSMVIGAIASSCGISECEFITEYSNALGTAYQIQDDIDDFRPDSHTDFSIMNALISETGSFEKAKLKAEELADSYKNQAMGTLSGVRNVAVKSHFFRLIFKIMKESRNLSEEQVHKHNTRTSGNKKNA